MSLIGLDLSDLMNEGGEAPKHKRESDKHVSLSEFENWIENILQGDRNNGDTFGKSFCNHFDVHDPKLCGMQADDAHEIIWKNYIK